MNLAKLEAQLVVEEGSPERTYLDTKGILTGGIGHNLMAEPEPGFDRVGVLVPPEMRSKWFAKDIQDAIGDLNNHAPWWKELDDVRQNAMLNLVFNMGWGGLSTFKNTLAALENEDFSKAANGIRTSQYAKDVGPHRSGRVAKMIETGEWPADIPA